MNLYLIERTDRVCYDEFDSKVVCAESKKEAVDLSGLKGYPGLQCKKIGKAVSNVPKGTVIGSFNAG